MGRNTRNYSELAWHSKPFTDLDSLYQSMVAVVNKMSKAEQLSLIKAHPDLGTKTKMAEASVQEQAGVGLDRLSESEYQRFQALNQAYKSKFWFSFHRGCEKSYKEKLSCNHLKIV